MEYNMKWLFVYLKLTYRKSTILQKKKKKESNALGNTTYIFIREWKNSIYD